MILVGIGLFGGLVLWLRGLNPGSRNYNLTVTFDNTMGMQAGTSVRYRGVPVGRVIAIRPGSNLVEVLIEITQSDLRIPREVTVSANQSGFIGETTIDITPNVELTETQQAVSPIGADCESGAIICNGDRLTGTAGISYESLLKSAETLATTLADPALINSLKTTFDNAAAFTTKASSLADELTKLTLSVQTEVRPISDSVQQATNSAAGAAQSIQTTAQEFQLTATDVRTLIAANQANLGSTLANLNQGSDRLTDILETIATEVDTTTVLNDLEVLSANAAAASVNFRDASGNIRDASVDVRTITGSLNQPSNLLMIQQTLESARNVFQSAQKVLSDVDELTGDPSIRDNIRDLINGLSNLLSSTEILEQQAELAIALAPLASMPATVAVPLPAAPPSAVASSEYAALHQQLAALYQAMTTPTPAPPPNSEPQL
jgi:phospholipid/cholesterol/gamma-HCH transport system substrate-binding protein